MARCLLIQKWNTQRPSYTSSISYSTPCPETAACPAVSPFLAAPEKQNFSVGVKDKRLYGTRFA